LNHGGIGDDAALPYSCGISHDDFDLETNAKTLEFHDEFVQCLVPKERLLKICVVCGNVTIGDVGDFIGVETENYHDKLLTKTSHFRRPVHLIRLGNQIHGKSINVEKIAC